MGQQNQKSTKSVSGGPAYLRHAFENIFEAEGSYTPACGGMVCAHNDPSCAQACLIKKDESQGVERGNLQWVCCAVAQRRNLDK